LWGVGERNPRAGRTRAAHPNTVRLDKRERCHQNGLAPTGELRCRDFDRSDSERAALPEAPGSVLGLSDRARRLRSADRPSAGVGPDRAGALDNDDWDEPAAAGIARIPAATAAARRERDTWDVHSVMTQVLLPEVRLLACAPSLDQ